MNSKEALCMDAWQLRSPIHREDAFSRTDESDDRIFYSQDRFVGHLDAVARATVERLIGGLVAEKEPVILDLMAGWDSHIPETLKPARVVGLGLNENELRKNAALTEFVVHDLNKVPDLPFPDNTFDAVINAVSVDYMTRPVEVFREVGRVLKPGGLFLVVFSDRMFPQKAVKVWKESDEGERVILVEEFFRESRLFEKTTFFVSLGKPRPADDKYAGMGIPSDPIYAVYADRIGGEPSRPKRPAVILPYGEPLSEKELKKREAAVKETLCCPHCGEKMKKWDPSLSPYESTWESDFLYMCFNDACPYFVRGWDFMYRQCGRRLSYRFVYDPAKDACSSIPVPTHKTLREGIIE
jgi:SAM-dependent methyltransferase